MKLKRGCYEYRSMDFVGLVSVRFWNDRKHESFFV
jgi:hypothetical protein